MENLFKNKILERKKERKKEKENDLFQHCFGDLAYIHVHCIDRIIDLCLQYFKPHHNNKH